MKKIELEAVVAAARADGDRLWSRHTRTHPKGVQLPAHVYNHFAQKCEDYFNASVYSNKVNNLRLIEAFLRCGKHLDTPTKIDNRRKADMLFDEILKEG